LIKKGHLGKVVAWVHVIEFQKRGLSGIDPLGTIRKLSVRKKKSDSYYNYTVILLGLLPCNPTRTPTL
jgi:hypothetical protein